MLNPIIFFIFIPHGKVFRKALDNALVQGQITPELTAAFNGPTVRNAHYAEGVIVAIIIFLMVIKPF